MKSKKEMDLQEWELVPDADDGEGFLEIISTDGGNKIYSSSSFSNTRTTVPHMNYFHYSYCPPAPPPPPPEFVQKTGPTHHLILLPPPSHLPIDLKMPLPTPGGGSESSSIEHDPVSSPKSRSGMVQMMLDHHNEDFNQFDPPPCKQVVVVDSEMNLDKGTSDGEKQEEEQGGGRQGLLKIWKWSINVNNGIGGAICSFGVAAAAATICCIISLRSCSNNIKHQRKLHHHLQIYTTTNDHKRMKQQQVVHHVNEAISTVIRGGGGGGGVPIITTAAHITFGGYYDAASSL